MTDTTQLIPNNLAVTSDLDYRLKPSAPRSRSYRASILPTNKNTFNPLDTAIVYIPGGRRNTYLDCTQSYMRMTLKNTDATGVFRLDGSANCMINRLDVFHGSNLLETIQTYNILSSYIFDMQLSTSNKISLANIYGNDTDGDRQGLSFAAGAQRTFCLPIFSGVVGCLNDKMLPIGLLADDIRLEFTFESLATGVVTTTAFTSAGTCQILDFQLQLTIVELSDEGENMVRSNYQYPQMPLYLHGCSWRHYVSQLPNSSGQYSTLVPARFASLKQLALLPRRSTEVSSATSYSLSSRVNPNFAQYSWRIGSSMIPSKPVFLENSGNTGGYGEAFAELLKSWHALHTLSTQSCLYVENYQVADATVTNCPQTAVQTGANSYLNGFVIAQELESFAQRSDVLLSGMNTLSSQVFFEAQINTAQTGATVTYALDFFAWYDHIMVIDQGIITIKY
jgi:hypothetical protein